MWTNLTRLNDLRYALMGKLCIIIAVLSMVLQGIFRLRPCSLCLIQRYSLFALGLCFIAVHFVRNYQKYRNAALASCYLPAVIGFLASVRQLWLQALPANMRPACVPDLDYLVKMFGTYEGARQFFFSSGGCGKVDFKILGLSLAHYSALLFLALLVVITVFLFKKQMLEGFERKPPREI